MVCQFVSHFKICFKFPIKHLTDSHLNILSFYLQDELKDYFGSAGNVTNTKILPLRDGKDTHLWLVFISFVLFSQIFI